MFAAKTLDSMKIYSLSSSRRCSPRPCIGISCLGGVSSTTTRSAIFIRREETSRRNVLFTCPRLTSTISTTKNTPDRHVSTLNATPGHLVAATSTLFTISTLFAATLGVLMIFLPHWSKTRQLLTSPWSLTPIALAYGILLTWSWQPDTFSLILPGNLANGFKDGFKPQFVPSLAGIVTLFSRAATAASLWVHILAINLFAAREIYLDGLDTGVTTRHTILLCLTFAPLALACHAVTKALLDLVTLLDWYASDDVPRPRKCH